MSDKMCNDANSMEFIQAMMATTRARRAGALPHAGRRRRRQQHRSLCTGKTVDNHWIVTGPHVMVFGPASKTIGLTQAKDPDRKEPYMMWAGRPYEHAMIPVAAGK